MGPSLIPMVTHTRLRVRVDLCDRVVRRPTRCFLQQVLQECPLDRPLEIDLLGNSIAPQHLGGKFDLGLNLNLPLENFKDPQILKD